MKMRIKVLASGSKGNLVLVESKEAKILIDFGLSYRVVKEKLKSVDVQIEEIDALFITHEHSDHIKGLGTLVKKHHFPIYLSQGTFEAISERQLHNGYNGFVVIKEDERVKLKDFIVSPFLVSHDAYEPFGYIVYEGERKLVYLTDTGYVSQANEERIRNADVYILETNHNVEMLMCTNRPWPLKQRILGNFGHLCNEEALEVLDRVKGENTKYVFLAHISEEANNHDLLDLTVHHMFKAKPHNIQFLIAYQYQNSQIVEV